MYALLISISVILAVLLIIVVLLQSSKGGGLAGSFGGSGQFGTVFGTRRTADFLSKITWWIGAALLILAIVINLFFLPGQTTSAQRESIIQGGGRQSVPTAPALPQQRSTAPAQK
ncbi:MAG: preprotein translocase subunit SecG [Ignavibacteriales bacterium]|nr:preprotein translocase subunit SecG [Ignavibacteriales bacterium]